MLASYQPHLFQHAVSRRLPSTQDSCPGCGLPAEDPGTAPPSEHNASAACWERFGLLLARSYADPSYRSVHQTLVDAYMGQHAGGTSRREIQRTALCLMTLCLVVEDGVDPTAGPALHKRMVVSSPPLHWLQPPLPQQWLTVEDVLTAHTSDQHIELVRCWGAQVWQAWAIHHDTIRHWNAIALA